MAQTEDWDLGPIPELEIECFAVSQGAGQRPPDRSRDGSWTQIRRDRRLTGRSPLVGNISCPQVKWQVDLGVRASLISLRPEEGASSTLELPVAGIEGDLNITLELFDVEDRIDLDGDGENVIGTNDPAERVGDFLPEMPGLERVSCRAGLSGTGPRSGDPLPCYLHNRRDAEWKLVWQTPPLAGFTSRTADAGNPVTGDFDNDGELEVAVEGWHDVYLLDIQTGAVEQTVTFTSRSPSRPITGRAYGWFGAFNLDQEPELELVMLADFHNPFVGVLGWQNGELVELWDHYLGLDIVEEPDIRGVPSTHRPTPNPVADLDGDGLPEIVTSIYNEHGDQRWHLVAFEGTSGDVVLDVVDTYLQGLEDLNGDGIAELLVIGTKGELLPERGLIRILSFDEGQLVELWSANDRGFALYDIFRFPDHVNSFLNYFPRRAAFVRSDWSGAPVFATRDQLPGGEERLLFYGWLEGGVDEIGSVVGPHVEILSLPADAPEEGLLLRTLTDGAERLTLTGVTATIESSHRARPGDGPPGTIGALLRGSVVSRSAGSQSPVVVAERFDETLIGYEVGPRGGLNERFRVSGRGMGGSDSQRGVSDPYGLASVLLAEVGPAGSSAVVSAGRAPDGEAVIRAVDLTGAQLWETSMGVPGDPPSGRMTGTSNWHAGHFRVTEREDVLVTSGGASPGRSSLTLLDGETGEPIWERAGAGFHGLLYGTRELRAITPSHYGIFDWDGDGLDEILNIADGLFAVYDGQDGALLFNRTTWEGPSSERIFPGQSLLAMALPVVSDFLSDGSMQILWGKDEATMALLDLEADSIWNTPFFAGMAKKTLQGVGDLDADGDLDLIVAGHCDDNEGDEIRVYEAKNGELRWTLDLPGACDLGPKHVTTVDLDGDGRDEALIPNGDDLLAVGETPGGQGQLLWKVVFNQGGDPGETVIADVDGSGNPQILVNTGEGYLYSLGAACEVNSETLCLNRKRFQVRIDWRDDRGNQGPGRRVPFGSNDSGLWWFFDENNWEMLVKVLDGCGVNGHTWVLAAATTNLEFTLEVTDTSTAAVNVYTNPLGSSAEPILDTQAFPCAVDTTGEIAQASSSSATARLASLPIGGPTRTAVARDVIVAERAEAPTQTNAACAPSATRLCLNQGRFQIEVEWEDGRGSSGSGRAVPFGADDSGLWWFFDQDNWEMLVKVLDGCAINQHFWLFSAATTNVGYTLRVTDTETGVSRDYVNPAGRAAPAITDIEAFAACS